MLVLVLVIAIVIVIVIEDIESTTMRQCKKSIEKSERLIKTTCVTFLVDYDYDYEQEHEHDADISASGNGRNQG